MKEIWRKVKNFSDYKISNHGRLHSSKSNKILEGNILRYTRKRTKEKINKIQFRLENRTNKRTVFAHRLVMEHFSKKEISNLIVYHKDNNTMNNFIKNLDAITRSNLYRLYRTKQGKERGVYPVPWKAIKQGGKKFRVLLKIKDKYVTLGYFKTKKEAVNCFRAKYFDVYGHMPY